MPTIQQRTNRFRQELADRETAATGEMVRAYTRAWEAIYAELRQLSLRVAAAENAGLYSPSWIYQENRLRSFAAIVESEIAKLTGTAEGQLSALSNDFVQKAEGHTQELIKALMGRVPEGATASFTRLNPGVLEAITAQTGSGSPVAALFDAMPAGTAERASVILTNGLALGKGMEEVARDIRPEVGGDMVRSIAITRTESLRAYRSAAIASYAANSDVVKGWQWSAQLSRRTCPVCIALNGSLHPLEEPFGSHVNCFPAGTLVSAGKVLGSSARRYAGEVVKVVTSAGHVFTCTPNHPVLTPQGFVGAGLLSEGDYVISARDSQRVVSSVNPNNNHVPAKIEDIAETLRSGFRVRGRAVPISAVDFHGDGVQGEISIIRANCFLRNEVAAALTKQFIQEKFGSVGAYAGSLMRGGAFTPRFPSVGTSAPCALCGNRSGGVLRGRFVLGNNDVAFELGTDRNAQIAQDTGNNHTADAVLLRKLNLRHSGNVFQDKIVTIRREPFVGHVYNLQTDSGYYTVNNSIRHNAGVCQSGVIVHNCRCVPIPYTASWAELGFADMEEDVPEPVTGADWFAAQSDDTQKAILGPGKFDLYKSGEINLTDVVGYRVDPTWGEVRYERSIKDIEANGARPGGIDPINPIGIKPFRLFPAPKITPETRSPRRNSRKRMAEETELPQNELSAQEARSQLSLIEDQVREAVRLAGGIDNTAFGSRAKEILKRQRELLFQAEPANVKVSYRAIPAAVKDSFKQAADDFARLVGKASDVDGKAVLIKNTTKPRSYYDNQGAVAMSRYADPAIVVHELGHWLEQTNSDIHAKVLDFYARRTQGETLEKLSKLTGLNYKSHEVAYKDKFLSPYMGKLYKQFGDQYATEILSMGLEYFYRDPVKLATADADFFDFIYNLVRGKL